MANFSELIWFTDKRKILNQITVKKNPSKFEIMKFDDFLRSNIASSSNILLYLSNGVAEAGGEGGVVDEVAKSEKKATTVVKA